MACSVDEQGRPIITVGLLGKAPTTFLCADLQQVRQQNGSYDFRRRDNLAVVGNTTVAIPEIEIVGA